MNIVFMGTPDFAIPCLEMIISEGYVLKAVVTQPDKPKGRGKKILPPPIKRIAVKRGINLLQPDKVKTKKFKEKISKLCPDLIVTVAYGKILPRRILDIPKLGCINVHASLLPEYRGAAPIHWSIINGESETGITTMLMDEGMDTGDILLREKIKIDNDMTAGMLHDKLSVLGARVLKETIKGWTKNSISPIKQNDVEATYAPMIDKNTGNIKWNDYAKNVHNHVRGTNPWPGAFTYYMKNRMKIWKTEVIENESENKFPGEILSVDNNGIIAACSKGTIKIFEIQFENRKKMNVEDYIHGHSLNIGEKFYTK